MLLKMCEWGPNQRCLVHANGGRVRQRGGSSGVTCCKTYFAQLPTAKPCVGCEGLVPAQAIWRMNPEVLVSSDAVEPPKLGHGFIVTLQTATKGLPTSESVICEDCALKALRAVNAQTHPGQIKLRGSERLLPLFLSPAGQRARERQKHALILELAEDIAQGRSVRFSTRDRATGLNQCVVHANRPEVCLCGGWHSWEDMPATVRYKRNQPQAFGFGPACAAVVRQGETLRFDGTFRQALESIKDQTRNPDRQEWGGVVRSWASDDPDDWSGLEVVPLHGSRPTSPPSRALPAPDHQRADQVWDDEATTEWGARSAPSTIRNQLGGAAARPSRGRARRSSRKSDDADKKGGKDRTAVA